MRDSASTSMAGIGPKTPPKTPRFLACFFQNVFFWGERGAKSLISLQVAKNSCLILSYFGPKNVKIRQNFRSYPPFLSYFVLF